jgi:hypothetical protein
MGSFRTLLHNVRLFTWLIGGAGTWLLLDYAFYDNTVSSQLIRGQIDPSNDPRLDTLLQLAIFVAAAAPGFAFAALLLNRRQ